MGQMKNNHCKDCNSKTKLLLKEGKEYKFWCVVGKTCPYSEELPEATK